jgi:hypothetical protein
MLYNVPGDLLYKDSARAGPKPCIVNNKTCGISVDGDAKTLIQMMKTCARDQNIPYMAGRNPENAYEKISPYGIFIKFDKSWK